MNRPLSLVEVAGANFRTDDESDRLNTEFMKRLGMRKRYLPARIAIARSLANPTEPTPLEEGSQLGKAIKGDTLFGIGVDLATWVSLIFEHAEPEELDVRSMIVRVAAHWKRGIELLDDDWNKSDKDLPKFVECLIGAAELPMEPASPKAANQFRGAANVNKGTGRLVEVLIGDVGENAHSGEKEYWTMNGSGGSPHCAVLGGSGSGKTVLATSMLRQIMEKSSASLIAFDFKGDLADFTGVRVGEVPFGKAVSASVLDPPRVPIPLDVLFTKDRSKIGISESAVGFRDSFTHLKGSRMGEVQRASLYEAIVSALEKNEKCELVHIRQELFQIYEEKDIRPDGATALMDELCRFPLFEASLGPRKFFGENWIVRLPPSLSDQSRLVVFNLLLESLDQYLMSQPDSSTDRSGARELRSICMIDEAHQILKTKLPALSRLVRMSRSKGGAVMLVSQSPDDFSGEDDDFLAQMGLVAAFSTNAKPGNAKRVLGKGVDLTKLDVGQAYSKRRGDHASQKIKVW